MRECNISFFELANYITKVQECLLQSYTYTIGEKNIKVLPCLQISRIMRYGFFYSIYKILYPTVKYDSKPSKVDLHG